MDNFKVRIWDKKTDKMWYKLFEQRDGYYLMSDDGLDKLHKIDFIDAVKMLHIGIQDRKNVDIYEGDFIRGASVGYLKKEEVYEVRYDVEYTAFLLATVPDGKSQVSRENGKPYKISKSITVIGNRYADANIWVMDKLISKK